MSESPARPVAQAIQAAADCKTMLRSKVKIRHDRQIGSAPISSNERMNGNRLRSMAYSGLALIVSGSNPVRQSSRIIAWSP